MASDSDDADFFDKLVDSDSDDDRRPGVPLAAAAAEASAGDLAALTLADQPDAAGPTEAAQPPPHAEPEPAPSHPKPEPELAAVTVADQPDHAGPPEPAALPPSPELEPAPPLPLESDAEPQPAAVLQAHPEAEADREHVMPQPAVPQAHPEAEADREHVMPQPAVAQPKTEVDLAVWNPQDEPETQPEPAVVHPVTEAPAPAPSAEAAAAREGGSPGSDKGVQTAVKQVQWNDFGAPIAEADPFAELLGDGVEDAFLDGAVAANQAGLQAPAVGSSAVDYGFSSAVDSNTSSQLQLHSGASAAAGYGDQSGNEQLYSADPKYLESLYPGWKYDEATQQWYQVDALVAQQNVADNSGVGAGAALGSDSVQQQQQQFGASYAQLETISEEANTNASTWGQDGSSAAPTEYPPNMLFYAEYPGWYFDTNTQQWQSLESYQQAVVQTAATSDGFSGNVHSAPQTEGSYTSSYSQQSQWQTGVLGNTMQLDGSTDTNLLDSFYGSDQKAENQIGQLDNAESSQSATNYINTFVPQYNGSDGNQASYEGLEQTSHQSEPSDLSTTTGYQNMGSTPYTGHQGFKPLTSNQSWYKGPGHSSGQEVGYKGLEPSAGYQTGPQVFDPSATYQTGHKGFEPSAGYQAGHKGFDSSAGYQAGNKGFDSSAGYQTGNKGFEPSAGYQTGNKGFEPSAGYQTQTAHKGFEPSQDYQVSHMASKPSTNLGYGSFNGVANPQSFIPEESMYKEQTHADLPNNYWGTQTSMDFAQQQFIGANGPQQSGFSPHEQRSSAGRPPHALVTFGFGGKLFVLKETSSMTANFVSGNQGNAGHTVSVLNIPEIVADKFDHSSIYSGSALSYFHALCRHPIPGPLIGGSAAAKDVNKWLDEMIGGYESSAREFQGGDVQKLLIALLKILCQHYGKLRSQFGSDPSQEGIDGPEMAVTKLFASCKSSANMKGYGAVAHCMKNIPLESQIQATAQEVQKLLVSGRRKEALQYAQEGQLWGPALILALQLGDKFYADTVKKMAHCHFVFGSPLRTLCLLIAGQPADVFNFENPADSGSLHAAQLPVETSPKGMLDDWQENLAIITANRTKGDDLVITHLGDSIWKEKNEVASAHSCYLVAELNIDSYSESARMCLIGADHLRCPRTFTSPEAIQRTEVYEYAKVLGNSQYILLPFQPYKLIYAYMLLEVGKISDALRYCQASLKALKASGRSPELEAWKQLFSSLEERIRTHQQGGYTTNLAPGKIVGKLFTSLDKSLSRMMGTQSAPLPQLPQGAAKERETYSAAPDAKVVNNQSVMSTSPLLSSASEQSMSEMTGNGVPDLKAAHNRSISEPDFGRSPQQGAGSVNVQSTSGSGSSRLGWLMQKTMGLVSKGRQAKLGEENKFYYDEKLKRWVEEGAAVPAEEPPLPPPPTKASIQSSIPGYNLNGPAGGGYTANGYPEAKTSNPSELSSGMPPIAPTQNQFSARGRMGVRSRYVDTFNKGGGGNAFGAATSFSKPAVPSMSPPSGAKFFVPTPATVGPEQMADSNVEAHIETTQQDEPSFSSALEAVFSSPPPTVPMQTTIQRYPSMDNIMTPSDSGSSSLSRSRAASWSGTYPDQLGSAALSRSPDGQTMQSPLIPGKRPPSRSSSNASVQLNGMGEDLHEVEL